MLPLPVVDPTLDQTISTPVSESQKYIPPTSSLDQTTISSDVSQKSADVSFPVSTRPIHHNKNASYLQANHCGFVLHYPNVVVPVRTSAM